jgi:hypothetical protein
MRLKSKSVQILVLVASLILGAFSIHGFIDLVRQTHTRALEREFAAAVNKLEKSPPGVERAETFVRNLKAISPGYAPPEVKQALQEYVVALEQSLAALKAGQDTTRYDAAIAKAREKLLASVKKYD